MSYLFVGPTDVIIEGLFGPRQYDDHVQRWRWAQFLKNTWGITL